MKRAKALWLESWIRWWRNEESLWFYSGKTKEDIELRLRTAFEAGYSRGLYRAGRKPKGIK